MFRRVFITACFAAISRVLHAYEYWWLKLDDLWYKKTIWYLVAILDSNLRLICLFFVLMIDMIDNYLYDVYNTCIESSSKCSYPSPNHQTIDGIQNLRLRPSSLETANTPRLLSTFEMQQQCNAPGQVRIQQQPLLKLLLVCCTSWFAHANARWFPVCQRFEWCKLNKDAPLAANTTLSSVCHISIGFLQEDFQILRQTTVEILHGEHVYLEG